MLTESAIKAGHDAYEAKARELAHVSGSPVPWKDVPEPYRSCTVAAYEAVLSSLREDPEVHECVAQALSNGGYRDDDGCWHEGLTIGDMDRAELVLDALFGEGVLGARTER